MLLNILLFFFSFILLVCKGNIINNLEIQAMKKVSCSVALIFFAECYNHTLGNMVIHIVQSIILHSISILLLSAYVGFLVPHLNLLPQGKVFKSAQAATLSNKHPQEEV